MNAKAKWCNECKGRKDVMVFWKRVRARLHKLLDNMIPDKAPVLCVWCGNRESIKLPFRPLKTVFMCSYCNRQNLVIGRPGKPYALNPALLTTAGLRAVCSHGCDFIEPYGFVPSADCPVHD